MIDFSIVHYELKDKYCLDHGRIRNHLKKYPNEWNLFIILNYLFKMIIVAVGIHVLQNYVQKLNKYDYLIKVGLLIRNSKMITFERRDSEYAAC
ncbi:hypothetical protein CUC15_04435 [Oceanobacillus zhaokaii]|uniref:Uncharacterized protein n=1 Tax=Oceanobacillus zhaokaii TaxID=2052660 RepID=A0A345PE22_9BACI|nr:hypothetical protein CUC15_04435 [Oceanobacillus zhaokaii]